MKRNLSGAHPEDTVLLAYLDAELSRAATRSTKEHLQTCWKCRAALAELELQAQAASKLLNYQDESDITRAEAAKTKFIERKALFEKQTRQSATRFTSPLYLQLSRGGQSSLFEQTTLAKAYTNELAHRRMLFAPERRLPFSDTASTIALSLGYESGSAVRFALKTEMWCSP